MAAEAEHGDLGRKHQLHGVQPVLPVADVVASARYFRDFLGFEIDFLEGDPPIHGRVMKGDGTYGDPIYIHLSKAPPEFTRPSKANEAAFQLAVDRTADVARTLLHSLVTTASPRDRELEAQRARIRAAARFSRA